MGDKVVIGSPKPTVFDVFHRLIRNETRATAHGPLYLGDPAPDAPGTPTGLVATATTTGVQLAWDYPAEGAYRTWEIHESEAAGFTPTPATLVAVTSSSRAAIPHTPGTGPLYYQVCAVSTTGARSEYAISAGVTVLLVGTDTLQVIAGGPVPFLVDYMTGTTAAILRKWVDVSCAGQSYVDANVDLTMGGYAWACGATGGNNLSVHVTPSSDAVTAHLRQFHVEGGSWVSPIDAVFEGAPNVDQVKFRLKPLGAAALPTGTVRLFVTIVGCYQ